MQNLMQIFSISICWIIVVVSAQLNQPQQSQPYALSGRRRFNNGGYSGFGASSLSPSGDFIKFPDDRSVSTATVNLIHSDNSENNFNGRRKNNVDEVIVESDKIVASHLRAEEVSRLIIWMTHVNLGFIYRIKKNNKHI